MVKDRRKQFPSSPREHGRVIPACPYFGACGGCALQDLAYPEQVALKQRRLRQTLAQVAGMPADIEVVGLEEPWRYRNKAELSFGESGGRMTLGFHAAKSFRRIIDVDDCLLLPEPVMPVLRDLRALAEASGLPPYALRTHQGFYRYAVIRFSHATRRMLLCVITSGEPSGEPARQAIHGIVGELVRRHPALSSVYWGRAIQPADVAAPEQLIPVSGGEDLEDAIGPFHLRLRPMSFLQTSSVQADRLYRGVCEALGDAPDETAWDLYCGLGLVGLYLSPYFKTIYAVDSEPHHLALAQANAAANGVGNIRWVAGRAEEVLMDRRFWLNGAKPDVVVVDPPRTGVHLAALSAILAARPRRIAYISCNPSTLARDLKILTGSFPRYAVSAARAFDMFPQTPHVETFVVLQRQ